MIDFKAAFQKIKDKVLGPVEDPVKPDSLLNLITGETTKLDIGPAKAWYIRRLFPKSVFTKKLTHCREQSIRAVFRVLREEQRAIALRKGWNRGLDV